MEPVDLPTQSLTADVRHILIIDGNESAPGTQTALDVGGSPLGSSLTHSAQSTTLVPFHNINGKPNSLGAPEFSGNQKPQAIESLSGSGTLQDKSTDPMNFFDYKAYYHGTIFSEKGRLENPVTLTNIQTELTDFPDADGPSASNESHAKCLTHGGSLEDTTPACSSGQPLATSIEPKGGPSTLPTEAHPKGKRSGEPLAGGRPTKARRTECSASQIVDSAASATPSGSTGAFYDDDRRGEGSSTPPRKPKRKPPAVRKGMPIEDWKKTSEYLDRKHACEECGERFARTDNLRRHVIYEHDKPLPWPCPNRGCNEVFARKDNGMQHLELRHKNICSACNKQFSTAAKLVAHLNRTPACS